MLMKEKQYIKIFKRKQRVLRTVDISTNYSHINTLNILKLIHTQNPIFFTSLEMSKETFEQLYMKRYCLMAEQYKKGNCHER